MELWIRSQDKEVLILANHLDIYNVCFDGEIKTWNIEESGVDLGEYRTKERVLEILDEIQELIQPTLICTEYHSEIKEFNKTEFKVSMQPNEQKLEYIHPQIIVYQMPKETYD